MKRSKMEHIAYYRELDEYQCVHLSNQGLEIFQRASEGIREERLLYGSYVALLYNCDAFYIGKTRDISLWGPLEIKVLKNMTIMFKFKK